MMHIEVLTDRIKIGAVEFVPRFLDLSRVLIVNAGETITPLADSTWDYIEVAGTLSISREHDTVLRFTHLVILPGGHLDCGSEDHPMPRHVEFIVRDVPIDLTRDPFQWGNGILNFGKVDRCGLPKTAFLQAAVDLSAGAVAVDLASAPDGWQVGDELLIPDMATPTGFVNGEYTEPRREARVTIAAIDGAHVTLSKPLDFDHASIVDPQGVVVVRPFVANLTRNIVVRSENPAGTAGHTADVGMMAMWCVCSNESRGLGRTTIDPLADAANGVAGANQRGRYAEHHHHVGSSPESMDVCNVYVGRGGILGAKWGLAHHNTSDTLVELNIVLDFPGAGFTTEDGYEVRNRFLRNFAAYNLGHAKDAQGNVFDAVGNVTRNAPGAEGTGYWLRGIKNYFQGNIAINNFTSGFNLFNQNQPAGLYPSAPGVEPDTPLNHFEDTPLSFVGNIAIAHVANGLEIWGVKRFPYTDLIAAHTGGRNVFAINSDGIDVYLVNPTIIGEVGKGSDGIHSSMGYVRTFELEGGQIAGCDIGIHGGGGANGMILKGSVVLHNRVNIDMVGSHYHQGPDVRHLPFGDFPHAYIVMGDGFVWDGNGHVIDPNGVVVAIPGPLPKVGVSKFTNTRGSDVIVENWQGTGQTYRLFERQSLAENLAWFATSYDGTHTFDCPVDPALRLTVGQSYAAFGLAHGGEAPKTEDTVALDGIVTMTEGGEINGHAPALLGTVIPYGPPRAILTYPNLREAPIVEGGANDRRVRISAILTGNPALASRVMMLQEDSDAPVPYEKDGDDRSYGSAHSGPGKHRLTVWRTNLIGVKIPGSESSTEYFIGDGPPPPVELPPPTTAMVPNVVGMTHASAVSAITTVRLLATSTMQHSATVPAGHILSQAPSAGSVVALGSSVNLIESDGPMPTLPPPADETWTATTITAEKSSKGRVRILIG